MDQHFVDKVLDGRVDLAISQQSRHLLLAPSQPSPKPPGPRM
jgi:hypothetical protein